MASSNYFQNFEEKDGFEDYCVIRNFRCLQNSRLLSWSLFREVHFNNYEHRRKTISHWNQLPEESLQELHFEICSNLPDHSRHKANGRHSSLLNWARRDWVVYHVFQEFSKREEIKEFSQSQMSPFVCKSPNRRPNGNFRENSEWK